MKKNTIKAYIHFGCFKGKENGAWLWRHVFRNEDGTLGLEVSKPYSDKVSCGSAALQKASELGVKTYYGLNTLRLYRGEV